MKRTYHKKRKKERKMTRGYRELSEAIHISLLYSHLLAEMIKYEIKYE
jgi:hypothetical protein